MIALLASALILAPLPEATVLGVEVRAEAHALAQDEVLDAEDLPRIEAFAQTSRRFIDALDRAGAQDELYFMLLDVAAQIESGSALVRVGAPEGEPHLRAALVEAALMMPIAADMFDAAATSHLGQAAYLTLQP